MTPKSLAKETPKWNFHLLRWGDPQREKQEFALDLLYLRYLLVIRVEYVVDYMG
jgi:hypothetical protein